MEFIRGPTILLVSFVLASSHSSSIWAQQSCDTDDPTRNGFIVPHTIHIHYSGVPNLPNGTRDSLAWTLGGCGNIDDFAMECLEFFESYGVDVSEAKRKPLVPHRSPEKIIDVLRLPTGTNYRVVSETFYNYARFLNVPLMWVHWNVWMRDEHRGPAGVFPANHSLSQTMIRYQVDGRDVCIRSRDRQPMFGVTRELNEFSNDIYNEKWGDGTEHGTYTIKNGTVDVRLTLTFP